MNSALKNDAVYEYIAKNFHKTIKSGGTELKPLVSPCVSEAFTFFFYWDTYFANLALFEIGDFKQVENNLDNMCTLIDKYGYIPNGYLPDSQTQGLENRSQPPLFSIGALDYYNHTKDLSAVARYLPYMEREYEFWMRERITPVGLNKYGHNATDEWLVAFCDGICQRLNISPEIYKDKVSQGGHFLAIAESGWDFTPRFEIENNYYACEDFAPVDLNAILFGVENAISEFAKLLGDDKKASAFREKMENRKALMDKYMKGEDGFYYDYNYKQNNLSKVLSAASFTPYTFGVSADTVTLEALTDRLLGEYGLPATEKISRECLDQWAYPSVWPPLTFFAVRALEKLNSSKVKDVAARYVNTVRETYKNTDSLWEKYDAEKGGVAYGHEYKTVEMFGWTAGVYTYVIKNYN